MLNSFFVCITPLVSVTDPLLTPRMSQLGATVLFGPSDDPLDRVL